LDPAVRRSMPDAPQTQERIAQFGLRLAREPKVAESAARAGVR
jgi:hypothetical protein